MSTSRYQMERSHLFHMLHSYITNKPYDCNLTVENETFSIMAHTAILCAYSPVLKTMLEDNQTVIINTQYDIIEALLDLIYYGSSIFSDNLYDEVLKLAKELQIPLGNINSFAAQRFLEENSRTTEPQGHNLQNVNENSTENDSSCSFDKLTFELQNNPTNSNRDLSELFNNPTFEGNEAEEETSMTQNLNRLLERYAANFPNIEEIPSISFLNDSRTTDQFESLTNISAAETGNIEEEVISTALPENSENIRNDDTKEMGNLERAIVSTTDSTEWQNTDKENIKKKKVTGIGKKIQLRSLKIYSSSSSQTSSRVLRCITSRCTHCSKEFKKIEKHEIRCRKNPKRKIKSPTRAYNMRRSHILP
ncbi:CLUMA_CG019013, isoform A [Clunio marinus]|uniref:CLUMA_CG019013, isoform A n=1 Tax=Clunio marinus TaxID=568069 RepID=A0A1J1J4R0_9DIPT|nr:CLUMA_CG019013, isoform A [Clunio marinus]